MKWQNNKIKKKRSPFLTLTERNTLLMKLSEDQKLMVQHLSDLNRKIDGATFNLQQLQFGRQAFIDALKASLDEKSSDDSEE